MANKKPAINFEKVHLARKSEIIGAQQLSLKAILKEKIQQKRNEEWIKREELKKIENEENSDNEEKNSVEEDEDILDDEDMSEEDSEEDEEEIDWEDEEARLREIDRRNRRKRIKRGSFLDDEAEDEDEIDELDEDSADGTPQKNKINAKDTKMENPNGNIFEEKKDLDNMVLAQSTFLPDTEELLADDHSGGAPVMDAPDNKPALGAPIHPIFLKASNNALDESGDNTAYNVNESTPCSLIKKIQSNQKMNSWTPLSADEFSLSLLTKSNESLDDSSTPARKKLGFQELFDKTDPQVDDMGDVIGLCSGQFLTQQTKDIPSQNHKQDHLNDVTENSQIICDTPDTVILTENLMAASNTMSDKPENSQSIFERDTMAIISEKPVHSQNILEKDTMPIALFEDKVETNKKPIDQEKLQPNFMEDHCGVSKILSSSSEDEWAGAKGHRDPSKRSKKLKKRKRLVLSDDDSDENNDELNDDESESNSLDYNEEREVMYDSEENEIDANQLGIEDKKEVFKGFRGNKGGLRAEFVEQEAELSGDSNDELNISEDEDERGLDRLMLEEGDMDEECADEDKIRDQLGRLHQRAILDEDQREVRLFQEAFLEDGELHSDNARARKFRWKDTDEDIDLERRPSDDEGEDALGITEQQDEKWRLERLEREKWVKESEIGKYNKINNSHGIDKNFSNDEDSDKEDSQFFSMATKAMNKLSKSSSIPISTKVSSMSVGGGDTLMAIANDISENNTNKLKQFKSPKHKMPLQKISSNSVGGVRGSFLSRCSSTLEKLAEMTKSASEVRAGTGAKNTRNFVFALLSPEKPKEETIVSNGQSSDLSDLAKPKEKSKGNGKYSKKAPDSKKLKIDRTIDENSSDTIFGFL